ncbi:MAG: hypothetical protein VKO21_07165 [Candidatus Sericytochromatia bacterium]|nr:hypothetical protein [Candidatus Sericytochromatia bacterium]
MAAGREVWALGAVVALGCFVSPAEAAEELPDRQDAHVLSLSPAYRDLLDQQQSAMALTAAWGLGSVGAGVTLLARDSTPFVRGFATQQVAWGAIDAAIGFWAWHDFARRREAPEDVGQRKWLHDLYLVNSALDLGYMALGAVLMAQADESVRGHGAGVLLQGAWLALFDGANAWLTRP